jgi:hypothetical protein
MRTFDTGATRDADDNKNDYEGYFSPIALQAYGDYMREHQVQPDGNVRPSDNWQKGMPLSQYIKSAFRHFMTFWLLHRGYKVREEKIGGVMRQPTMMDALAGLVFNVMGYMHEYIKAKDKK